MQAVFLHVNLCIIQAKVVAIYMEEAYYNRCKEQVNNATLRSKGEVNMSEDEIKELIQTELKESGYMYTLGMLKGMYKAGAFNAVEWCTLSMYLADLNMEILG
jgi:hypothetical protein